MISRNVYAATIDHDKCTSCGKDKSKRKKKSPAPICLVMGPDVLRLCMRCAKMASDALDQIIEKIERRYK